MLKNTNGSKRQKTVLRTI